MFRLRRWRSFSVTAESLESVRSKSKLTVVHPDAQDERLELADPASVGWVVLLHGAQPERATSQSCSSEDADEPRDRLGSEHGTQANDGDHEGHPPRHRRTAPGRCCPRGTGGRLLGASDACHSRHHRSCVDRGDTWMRDAGAETGAQTERPLDVASAFTCMGRHRAGQRHRREDLISEGGRASGPASGTDRGPEQPRRVRLGSPAGPRPRRSLDCASCGQPQGDTTTCSGVRPADRTFVETGLSHRSTLPRCPVAFSTTL